MGDITDAMSALLALSDPPLDIVLTARGDGRWAARGEDGDWRTPEYSADNPMDALRLLLSHIRRSPSAKP